MSIIEFDPQCKKCLVCHSNRLHNFRVQALDAASQPCVNILECKNCTFAWQYPLGRTERQSVQYIEDAYAKKEQTGFAYFSPDLKRDTAKLQVEFLSRLPVKNRILLDIGAGVGVLAEMAVENDWNVTTVDPALDLD